MDKGVVEGGKDVSDTKDQFTFSNLRAERNDFLFLHHLFLGRLIHTVNKNQQERVGCVGGREYGTMMGIRSEQRAGIVAFGDEFCDCQCGRNFRVIGLCAV